jgi:hypothetical protein
MARTIYLAFLLAILQVLGCAAGGASDPEWTTSETRTELRLTQSSPSVIAGSFTRAGTTVWFEARKTDGAHSVVLKANDGRVLLSTAGAGETRVITMLEGRLTITPRARDIALPEELNRIGDDSAFAELLLSPEVAILPWLSRALGENGITGVSHPASLDLHTFSAVAARAHDIDVPAIGSDEPERAAQDGNGCYGTCGKGCSCWKWVCGDCDYHPGCAAHDNDCRKCSWSHPWACTKCATFASFWTGGGC